MARRSRTYRAEYEARIRRARQAGVPTTVARGHGPVPLRIAKRLEAQRRGTARKPISRKTFDKYRRGIGQYQKRYWGGFEVGSHTFGVTRHRRLPARFASREQAEEYLDDEGYHISGTSLTFEQLETGEWVIHILH